MQRFGPTVFLVGLVVLSPLLCCWAGEQILHVRHDGRHWQIWAMTPQGEQARPLTGSPRDKRSLRAVPGRPEVLFRDNQGRMYRLDAQQVEERPVDLPGVEVAKDFDLDPGRGYLIATYAPNAYDNIRLWWYAHDGSDKRLVIADPHLNEMPCWVAAREAFLFVKAHRGMSRICRATLSDPKAIDVLADPFAAISDPAPDPTGRDLAYCRETQQGMDLWLARLDGSNPRSLYAGPGMETDPAWSRAGDRVYFSSWDGQHFRIAAIQPDGDGFVYLSPEGMDCRYPVSLELQAPQ